MHLIDAILSVVAEEDLVLDVGGGMADYHRWILDRIGTNGRLVIVDAHQPYLDRAVKLPNVGHLCADARRLLPMLQDKAYDVVLGLDFIEHMPHLDAIQVIEEMKRVCQRTLALFIPEGNHPQTTDHWKLGGEQWQTHRSTWWSADVEALDFEVTRWPDFHAAKQGRDPGALWATWNRGT